MGADDVFPAEMPEHGLFLADPLDDDTAERLVAGRVGPDDAPPGYARVASVLQAAAGPAAPEELAGREAALAMFRAHRPAGERGRRGPATRRRAGGRARARVVALALAGVLAAGGLWMADGGRTFPGLRFPAGGAGAGRAGPGAPGVVTRARPLAPPVTAAGANARAPAQPSARTPSTGNDGGVTASRAHAHGARQHRPGKPPKPKPAPKPKQPKPEKPEPEGKATPRHQQERSARR